MTVEYSNRALADIRKISADSRRIFGEETAAKLGAHVGTIIEHLASGRQSAPELEQRPGVHVAVLVHYPYKIFYRVFEGRIRIQHIRHTSRRQWEK